MIAPRAFYERDTFQVAKDLLGKLLVHETSQGVTSGKITETEAYIGPEDKASHAYGNLRTKRNEVLYGPRGHAYIYFVYGMYYCLNVTSGKVPGKPEAILIRALEPEQGLEKMLTRRKLKEKSGRLANGPGKLCIAMGLTTAQNGADLTMPPLHINDCTSIPKRNIVSTTRIGVDYADAWKHKPWRFYVKGSKHISKP